jgi:hypothetical protein
LLISNIDELTHFLLLLLLLLFLVTGDILSHMPGAWPGLETPESLEQLLQWGLRMTASPKPRECDAGAMCIRLVFRKYVRELGWRIPLTDPVLSEHGQAATTVAMNPKGGEGGDSGNGRDSAGDDGDGGDDASLHFFRQVIGILDGRLSHMERVSVAVAAQGRHLRFEWETGATPLSVPLYPDMSGGGGGGEARDVGESAHNAHGVILVLRYLLEEINLPALTARLCEGLGEGGSHDDTDKVTATTTAPRVEMEKLRQWRGVVDGILGSAIFSLRAALHVVGESHDISDTKVGEGGATGDDIDDGRGAEGVGGEGAGVAAVPRLKVDCRGHLITESAGAESATKGLVVRSWLLVKECSLIVGTIVREVPLPKGGDGGERGDETEGKTAGNMGSTLVTDNAWLLPAEQVVRAGGVLLDALLSLKHMGAITAAGEGFRMICERLLDLGSQNRWLCRQPERWLDGLLHRVNGANAQVRAALCNIQSINLTGATLLNCVLIVTLPLPM